MLIVTTLYLFPCLTNCACCYTITGGVNCTQFTTNHTHRSAPASQWKSGTVSCHAGNYNEWKERREWRVWMHEGVWQCQVHTHIIMGGGVLLTMCLEWDDTLDCWIVWLFHETQLSPSVHRSLFLLLLCWWGQSSCWYLRTCLLWENERSVENYEIKIKCSLHYYRNTHK